MATSQINPQTASFPALPEHPSGGSWSSNVHEAYQFISSQYHAAAQVLVQEVEPARLKFHATALTSDSVPLLLAMEAQASSEQLPTAWIHLLTTSVGQLIFQLCEAHRTTHVRDDANLGIPVPVTLSRTGHRGRPRKNVDPDLLHEALSNNCRITITRLAEILGISRPTLYAQLRKYNVSTKFSEMTDAQLDTLVKIFRSRKPQSGIRYLVGFLRGAGLRVQKRRVIGSLRRTDRIRQTINRRTHIQRRKYTITRPNALWHVDGHHKLILWGIVIHGMVDGYCRSITGLRASDNNRASTVLQLFLDAVGVYGMPSRVRGDRGKENKGISIYMILVKGLNRGSFIWGLSTHNTRIERLWVEVGKQFARQWRAFFYRLERLHGLDRSNSSHLWLLHTLFLSSINDDCKQFQDEWNGHPLSGEGHDQSPMDMRLLGQLKHGVYLEDCAGMTQDEIASVYGAHGPVRSRNSMETGAGYLSDEELPAAAATSSSVEEQDDEEDNGWDNLSEQIGSGHSSNFLLTSPSVPKKTSPFPDNLQVVFAQALEQVVQAGQIPSGYGMLAEEWEGDEYPAYEVLRSGKRGRKDIQVALPNAIWQMRAQVWVQALDVMQHLMYMTES